MRQFTSTISTLAIAFLLVMPAQSSLDKGLLVYFDFDKSEGKTLKNRANKNDGQMNDKVKLTPKGKYKGGLDCTDPDSSVIVESFPELEKYNDNTYMFWINFTKGTNGKWSQIVAKKAPGSDRSPGIWICPDTLNLHWRFNPDNKGTDRCGPTGEGSKFDLNKWYHTAGVKRGSELKLYIDGKEVTKATGIPSPPKQGEEKLYIGKTGYRSATFLLDDLAVYDRALTEAEVNDAKNGKLSTAVELHGKLAVTWGDIRLCD